MKMKIFLGFLTLLFSNLSFGQTKYEKDFNEFWDDVNNNYAYFDQQQINWNKVKEIYHPQVKQITNNNDFIRFMESVLNEFHNGHISLNTNLNSSNHIIPSGQDIFVQKQNDKYIITDIRKDFGADLCGLKIGDVIVLFNNKSITEQVENFLPKYTAIHTQEMYQYALNMLFAGTHDTKRIITIYRNGKQVDFFPDNLQKKETTNLIETKKLNKTTAYIKINNSLGNSNSIADFDKAVDEFIGYKNLVIDLSETASGGNSTVARCIMGRFISKTMPYQQHEFDEKEFQTQRKWVEYVTPRKTQFKGNVFIIVGHWTGSMGEGIAIGFDGLKRAKIIGTEMAKLLGAINGFTMSETNIGFQIPTERLYHINGTPREKYKPTILTQNIDETLKKMYEIK
ncbi:MAG: peptidase [Bacteroidetes bacterium]|jgi:carboxyl-terminal processing protease|nr:peptidase [Bacteroidota bacterium]MCA6445165.1 peptidase [Bacteroidota bacterium]